MHMERPITSSERSHFLHYKDQYVSICYIFVHDTSNETFCGLGRWELNLGVSLHLTQYFLAQGRVKCQTPNLITY